MMKRVSLNRAMWCAGLVGLAATGLLLVACDGGSSPTAPAPPPPADAAAPQSEAPVAAPEGERPVEGKPGGEAIAALAGGQPVEGPEPQGEGPAIAPVAGSAAAKGGQPKLDLCHWDRSAAVFVLITVGQPGFDNHLANHPIDKPLPTWWHDADGDGFGDAAVFVEDCDQPAGFVDNDDDCDDAASSCTTVCGGDEDADGRVDCLDRCADQDGDGYGVDRSGTVVGGGGIAVGDCSTDGVTPCDVGPACLGEDCDDGDPDINPAADDSDCDGVDDDCDGAADDDYVETPTSCGFGVCEASGQLVCQAGSEVDTCAPGAPTETPEMTCDDLLDNDCDGLTDSADTADCGDQPPVAGNDWIIGCNLGADLECTANAPAGTLFNVNPGSTASGYAGADFDPEGGALTSFIAGMNVVGATGDPWSPPGPQPRTCTGDWLCTTDSNFVVVGSSLTVNADGSFTLTYETSVAPIGSLIGEFLYRVQDPGGQQSDPALVEVIINP